MLHFDCLWFVCVTSASFLCLKLCSRVPLSVSLYVILHCDLHSLPSGCQLWIFLCLVLLLHHFNRNSGWLLAVIFTQPPFQNLSGAFLIHPFFLCHVQCFLLVLQQATLQVLCTEKHNSTNKKKRVARGKNIAPQCYHKLNHFTKFLIIKDLHKCEKDIAQHQGF